MYVIIVGCGNIGASLAKIMQEEHNVVIVDKKSENFSKLGRGFNGISIEGNGLDLEILKEAGIEKADAVVATTGYDNTNIALAQISKRIFNVPKVVARVSDPEKAEFYRMLGVDLISSTSLIAALIRDKIIERRFSTYILESSKLTTLELRVDKNFSGKKIREIKPYDSIGIRGIVDTLPIVIKGGHVIFKITDGSCSIDCAVFKPTGKMTEIASRLMPGDIIEIFGGAKPNKGNSLTINIEKLRILKLTIKNQMVNPKCPKCGTTMKSEGKNKGFQCPKCKYRANVKKNLKVVPRKILEGLYIPPPRAHRHLTKPSIRYGKEKTRRPRKMIEQWYWSKKITKMPIRES